MSRLTPVILSCEDFEKADVYSTLGCCTSCHWDEYDELSEVEPPDKAGNAQYNWSPKILAYGCCGLRDSGLTRSDWAKTVMLKIREYMS